MKNICMKLAAFLGLSLFTIAIPSAINAYERPIKEGFYKSLGIGAGWYNYHEMISYRNDAFAMAIYEGFLNIMGNIGYAEDGMKFEAYLDANAGVGAYQGRTLPDYSLPLEQQVSKQIWSIDTSTFYHLNLIIGYDVLSALNNNNIRLYAQSGLSYYFNRNDFTPLERLQGYLSIPLQLETEIMLNGRWSLNAMGGFEWFLFGHHLSRGAAYQLSEDLNVIQKKGLGAKAHLGFSRLNDNGTINTMRLVYEYWALDDSPPSPWLTQAVNKDPNAQTKFYEPKNASHILTFQYIWTF